MQINMVSYADNFEDVVLHRAFHDVRDGFYIDVGAYDPVEHSVTQHFYQRGWRGINVEPNPAPFARIEAARDRDVNLNIGLSDREGRLTVLDAPGACWSVDRVMVTDYFGASADQIVEREIPVSTLARVCDRHVPAGRPIEFLKIDVEGHEREVIEGADWSRWRPRVVVCESNDAPGWEPILLAAGYIFTLFDGVNRFYLRGEDEALLPRLTVPANVGDRFLIHGYLRRIDELERSLGEYSDLGPTGLRIARQAARSARRHPRVAALAKRIAARLRG